jgi:Fe-Mn family superoxide dismutase
MMMTRREAFGVVAAGTSAALLPSRALVEAAESPTGGKRTGEFRAGQHTVVPLPFDGKKLRGISEKMIVSHWQNNYGGAVKNLNKVEEELARIGKDAPGFLLGALKEKELTYTNSLILHELYFGNLGGDGKPGGAIQAALGETYGTLGRWEETFRNTGASLGGGSGWTVLDWNFQSGTLRTYWSGNHTQALAFGAPLLVLDMYEHAYQMDYGAAAAKYLEAFMANVDWQEVNRRFDRAGRLGALYRPTK